MNSPFKDNPISHDDNIMESIYALLNENKRLKSHLAKSVNHPDYEADYKAKRYVVYVFTVRNHKKIIALYRQLTGIDSKAINKLIHELDELLKELI